MQGREVGNSDFWNKSRRNFNIPNRIDAHTSADMTQGALELRGWIDRMGLKDQEFAARLGISKAYASQLLSGVRRPGLDIAESIRTLTGIPIASWLDRSLSGSDRRSRIPAPRRGTKVHAA